jgi:hypothetical protein
VLTRGREDLVAARAELRERGRPAGCAAAQVLSIAARVTDPPELVARSGATQDPLLCSHVPDHVRRVRAPVRARRSRTRSFAGSFESRWGYSRRATERQPLASAVGRASKAACAPEVKTPVWTSNSRLRRTLRRRAQARQSRGRGLHPSSATPKASHLVGLCYSRLVKSASCSRSTVWWQVRQRPAQHRRTGWRSSTAWGSVRPAAGLLGRVAPA